MHLEFGESRSWMTKKNKGAVKQIKRNYLSDGSEDAKKAAEFVCTQVDWELEEWFGYDRPLNCSK